jgi:glycosyltransferase involved in cell wall biosynthesis
MNINPLVSVIIPAYNAERYLAEAIESVLAQSYYPLEIIVVNDGSTDNTAAVAANFGDRISYHHHQNSGLSRTLNRGVGLARGEFLAFLDADDLWASEKTRLQVEAFAAAPELEAVFGGIRHFLCPTLDAASRGQLHCPAEDAPGYFKLTMLIRREAFRRVGGFDERWQVGDFVDWFARAREAGLRTRMLDTVVALRRIHGANLTRRESHRQADYLRILHAALERRRQQTG